MTEPLSARAAEEALTLLRSFEADIPAFAQVIRNAHFSSQGALPASTWLRSQQQLSTLIGGSVLIMDEGVVVVPPHLNSTAPVKRMLGEICIRVSRDGGTTGTKFTSLKTLTPAIKLIMPAAIHMAEASGRLADSLMSNGQQVRLRVERDSTSQKPRFTALKTSDGEELASGEDIERIISELGLDAFGFMPFPEFCTGNGWGLPPPRLSLVSLSLMLSSNQEALDVCEALESCFSLELLSSLSLGEYCVALAGITASDADANELAYALAAGGLTFLRASCDSLLSLIARVLSKAVAGFETAAKAIFTATSKHPAWINLSPFYHAGAATRSLVLERTGQDAQVFPPTLPMLPITTLPPDKPSSNLRPASRPPSPSQMRPPVRGGGESSIDGMSADALREMVRSLQRGAGTPPFGLRMAPAAAPAGFAVLPTPTAPAVVTIQDAMQICGTGGGAAVACAIIIPAAAMSRPVASIVASFASAGLTDVASQFAFAAGDTRVMTHGSVLQAESILRHMEEVFEDLEEVPDASFHLLDHAPASDWSEGASLVRRLLTAHYAISNPPAMLTSELKQYVASRMAVFDAHRSAGCNRDLKILQK